MDCPDECRDKFTDLMTKLDKIDKKLFEDNGNPCHQSRINSNTQQIKLLTGIFVTVGTLVLTSVAGIIVKLWGIS